MMMDDSKGPPYFRAAEARAGEVSLASTLIRRSRVDGADQIQRFASLPGTS